MQTKGILLDTHVWLWLLTGDQNLSQHKKKLIEASVKENQVYIAAISIWEIAMLASKGKVILPNTSCIAWVNNALTLPGISLVPVSPEIAVASCELSGNFHGDSADRILVATAKVENLSLVTRDKKILDYGAKKYISTVSV